MLYVLLLATIGQAPSDIPAHERNQVLRAAIDEGLEVGGVRDKLPEPTFRDDATAEAQKASLVEVAGSLRGADEMLRPSLSAPHKFRLNDRKAEGATVRSGDLYFVLHDVDLDAIAPSTALGKFRGDAFEAGNMRFKSHLLSDDEARGLASPPAAGHEWLIHSEGRLLDRIAVESTDRLFASRSADSLILASRTDPALGPDAKFPNRWSTVAIKAGGDVAGPAQAFAGGIGYAKLTRLKGQDKVVLVETHFAFAEPTGWFDGAPILRSKLGMVAQDQVRRIRRELEKPRG